MPTLLRGSLTICDLLLEIILQQNRNMMLIQAAVFSKIRLPVVNTHTHTEIKQVYYSPLQQGMGQGIQLVHLFLDF